jgi:hypothetical protein
MFKKMFALASVTALTGLVAAVAASGCSSTVTPATDTAETGVPPAEAGKPKPNEGGTTPEVEAGPATCPSTTAITVAEVQASFKWQPPGPVQTACTQKNLDDLSALFKKGMGSAKYTEIKTTLGNTCAACAFTKQTATAWGLFLEDASGKVAYDNSVDACLAIVDSTACGKADAEFQACADTACADCADQPTFTTCTRDPKLAKGACKAFVAPLQAACTKNTEAQAYCNSATSILAVVCGGGPDGGLDAQ